MIPLFKPMYNKFKVNENLERCFDIGWTGPGFKTIEFEEKWGTYTSMPHCHFLNSATSGLHLAIEHIKQTEADHYLVLTSPLTFASSAMVAYHASCSLAFVDVDHTLTINPEFLRNRIERLIKLKRNVQLIVIFVGHSGNTGNYYDVLDVCKEYSIPLILDASHMAGTFKYESFPIDGLKHIGSEANYTVFSFQAVKNLSAGDGGMIHTRTPKAIEEIKRMSWLGINKNTWAREDNSKPSWQYTIDNEGWKYQGNSIAASIALGQLPLLEADNHYRREISLYYDHNLSRRFSRYTEVETIQPSRHLYTIRVSKDIRDDLIQYLYDKGIGTGVHYRSLTQYNLFRHFQYTCPEAERIGEELITIPNGPHITDTDAEYITRVLNEAPLAKLRS